MEDKKFIGFDIGAASGRCVVASLGVQAITSGAVPDVRTLRMMTAGSFQLKKYEPKNLDYFLENEQNYKSILNQDYNASRS